MRFSELFSGPAETRAISPSDGAWMTGGAGPTHAGQNVTQDTGLALSAVYSAVSLIADGVASLPIDVIRSGASGTSGTIEVPKPGWLTNPNPYGSRFDFFQQITTSLLLDGNSFTRVVRNDRGKILAVIPLDSRKVRVELNEIGTETVFKYDDKTLTSRDVVHVRGFSRAGELRGLSPLETARESVALGLAVEEFGGRFFSQGTTLSGVIEHPGNPKPAEVSLLRAMFRKTHTGTKNSHAMGILTGGATFRPISVTPEQAQFLETRRFSRLDIASLFRIPPYMLDPTVASSWGSGVEEQHNWYVQNTLMPWLNRIEEAFSPLLPAGQQVRFNPNARLRAKTSERFTAYRTAIEAGFMTVDEVRALEDLPALAVEPVAA